VDLLVAEVESRLMSRDVKMQISDSVRDFIIEKGFDPQLGAGRSVAHPELLEDPLADEILRGKIPDNSLLKVARDGELLTFSSKKETETEKEVAASAAT